MEDSTENIGDELLADEEQLSEHMSQQEGSDNAMSIVETSKEAPKSRKDHKRNFADTQLTSFFHIVPKQSRLSTAQSSISESSVAA
jgi:hypothetical protein